VKQTLLKLAELALTHLATFAFPLVFAVICGRTLGQYNYGVVSTFTAWCGFLGVIVEFGFDWHGIREVSPARDNLPHCHRVLWNITAARLLVCAVVMAVMGCAALAYLPAQELALLPGAAAFMVGFALDVSWYLRAHERTRILLALTVGIRLAGIGVLLWLVREADDLQGALWSYALVSLSTSLVSWALMAHQGLAKVQALEWRYIVQLMRSARAILLGNLNGALLTNGGIVLLSLVASPATVGAASLALRVKMAGQAVLLPLNQLGYVRITALAKDAPREAVQLGRKLLIALMSAGIAVALVAAWSADWIALQVFKTPTPLAAGLIILAALSVPMNAAGNLFGMQSLIAFGAQRAYALALFAASAVFCAVLFAWRDLFSYGWALLSAEAVVLVLAALCLRRVIAGAVSS
jgi:O-antigen/teichoic acid export membrane protein